MISSHSIEDEDKIYKITTYPNSDNEPNGITIKCNTDEFVKAHQSLKKAVIKGSNYNIDCTNLRILDISDKKAGINATVSVSKDSTAGNVDLKIYNPSVKKKKGATIEIRKNQVRISRMYFY